MKTQEIESNQQYERREYRRYSAALTVQMLSSETVPLNVRTSGLSLGGMHIECDRQLAQLMVPPAGITGEQEPTRQFTARISAKTKGNSVSTITISTGPVAITEVDDDQYRVSLRFDRYYGKSRQVLEEFLNSLD